MPQFKWRQIRSKAQELHLRSRTELRIRGISDTKQGQHIQLKSKVDRAYLAGLTDGEGTITILWKKYGFVPLFHITTTSEEIRDYLSSLGLHHNVRARRRPNRHVSYLFHFVGFLIVREILQAIFPYLVLKKKVCGLVLTYIDRRLGLPQGTRYSTEDLLSYREVQKYQMRRSHYKGSPPLRCKINAV